MPYDIHLDNDSAEVHLHGEFTFAQHRKFRHVVSKLRDHAPGQVVVNLSKVEYIDAAGLGLLLVARDAVSGTGGRATLKGASGQVGRMLAVARFDALFQAA